MKKRNWKERICALMLAVLLPLTNMLPGITMVATAAGTEETVDVGINVYEEMSTTDVDGTPTTEPVPLAGATVKIYAEREESTPLLSAITDEQGDAYVLENESTKITKIPVTYDTTKSYFYSVEKVGYVGKSGLIKLSEFNSTIDVLGIRLERQSIQLEYNGAEASTITLDLSESQNTAQLTITPDNGEYTWESSNPAVATVDNNGLITVHKAGKTTVKVTCADQTVSVEVVVKDKISGMSITANPGSNETGDVVDATGVVISVGNMPADATGTVKIYRGTEEIGAIDAPYSDTVTCDAPVGKTTFTARYFPTENDYYLKSEVSTEEISYKKAVQLQLMNVPVEGIHATYDKNGAISIAADDSTVHERTIKFALAENAKTGVLEIVNNQISIIGAGTTTVKVTAEASDAYTESTTTVDVTVDAKPVTIQASLIQWKDAAQKVYDGSPVIGLTGRTIIDTDVELEIPVKANLESMAVGDYQKATFVEIVSGWEANYPNYAITWDENDQLTVDQSVLENLSVKITKRPLYVQMHDANAAVEYSKVTAQISDVIANYKAVPLNGTGKNDEPAEGEDTNLQGVVTGEEETVTTMLAAVTEIVQTTAATSAANPDAGETPITDTSYVGTTYNKALKLQMNPSVTDTATGNYEVYIKPGQEYGSVNIIQEKISDADAWSFVQVQKVLDGKTPYTDINTGKMWIAADTQVRFSIPGEQRYTDVYVKSEANTYQSQLAFGSENNKGKVADVTNAFYLSNSGDDDTRTTQEGSEAGIDNSIPEGMLMLDAVNPVVEFADSEKNLLQDLYSADYKFGDFVDFINKAATKEILVSDVGSGLAGVSYTLVPVTETNNENLKNAVKAVAADSNTSWTEVTCTADGKGSISIPADTNVYYLVLVKVADNVGNQAVYASNGIVVDLVNPTVKATITTEKETEQFAGNVDYTIEVIDPADAGSTSGIAKIVVQVCASGAEVIGGKLEEENVYADSFTLDNEALNAIKAETVEAGDGYSIEELETKSNYTISGRILAETCNSNDVTLMVTAYDQAGNTASCETMKLAIDKVAPEIVGVAYDKTEEDNVYPDRTMTITYKERNFDPTLASFEITEDDGSQTAVKTVTLKDILDGNVAGLSAKDKSANTGVIADDTLTTYDVTFGPQDGKDITYTVKPSIKDKAGTSATTAEQVFTIDNKVPTVSVQYDHNDVKNERYFNQERTMTVTYTERNFDENLATFDVTVSGGETKTVKLAELADEQSFIQAGTVTEGTKENGYMHTYQFTFGREKNDVDYTIVPHMIDQAENVNAGVTYAEGTEAGETFTVDMVAPVMAVTYRTVNPAQDVTASIGTQVQDSMYHNDTIEANVTITERNFSAVGTEVTETATDVNGEEVTVADQSVLATSADKWMTEDGTDVHNQTFTFAEEANYTFNMSYTDLAGNQVVLSGTTEKPEDYRFTVDKTAPTGEISIDGESAAADDKGMNLLERIFKFFLKQEAEGYITTSGEEATSPVKVSYYKYYPGKDANGTIEALSEEKLKSDEITWTPVTGTEETGYYTTDRADAAGKASYLFEASYDVEKPEQFIIYEKIEDKAGHVIYLNADGIICEDEASIIKVSIDTEAPSTSFDVDAKDVVYNGDVEITLNVTDYKEDDSHKDANGNAVYSGLASVEYEIRNNGTVTQKGNFNEELSNPAARVESLEKKITIDAALNNSNNVTVYVKAVDNAGNEAEYTYGVEETPIKIDITKPTIDVSYDLNSAAVKNEKYFNADRTMTITYTERNINKAGLTFDFSTTEKDYGRVTLEQLRQIAAEAGIEILSENDSQASTEVTAKTDNRTLTCTIKFTGGEGLDMDYHIVPHIEDQASNTNETNVTYSVAPKAEGEPEETVAAPVEFTIDKTQPTMAVKYYQVDTDANGKETLSEIPVGTDVIDRLYKNKTIRAVATINERNFSLTNEAGRTFTAEYEQMLPGFVWVQHDGNGGDVTPYENAAKTAGNWKTTTSQDGTFEWTQSFDFVADGDYTFDMAYTDLAGNTLKEDYETHYYTVDKVAPSIDVVYMTEDGTEVTPGTAEADRLYYSGEKITATVTIEERNFLVENAATFEDGQMELVYTAVDDKAKKVEVTDYSMAANTRANWTDQSSEVSQYARVQAFEFTVDANYTFALTYRDQAGNECVYDPDYFTVDDTIPTGTISVTAQKQVYVQGDQNPVWSWDVFNPDLYFGIFDTDKVTVSWTTDDMTAGVAKVGYYKYTPPTEARNEFQWLSYEQMSTLSDTTDWIWTTDTQIVLDGEQQAIIYLKIVDRAGNVRYINTKEGIVIDDTEPDAPEIQITTKEPAQDIYNGNVDFQIDVVDPVSGGTYSGLYDVHYEVTNNGQVTQSGTYAGELNNPAARVQSITKTEQVNAELNNSNHVRITVWATDYAGNTIQAYKDLAIDITAPQVWITYDLYNGLNERYYNAVRTATVHVKERNFDTNAVDFAITNTDGVMPEISAWTISDQAGESDEAENTCTVVFAADGDYTIAMNCTDKAGNASAAYQMQPDDDFTIDRTVPTIAVSYDNNNVANGSYYKAPRTATITVNEHNFNGAEVQAAIAATLQSQGITPPPVNGWTTNGDIHTATVYFSADGDYSFTINYSDLAGNPAVEFVQSQFTVDQTKPSIEIFDIIDKSANNGVVAPGVNYSDVNYTPAGVSISIRGAQHAAAGLDGTRTNIVNGESIKMADFAYEEAVDDVYVLTAQVTDLAGNVEEKSVTFSVNRFGSNFIFSDETAKYLDQYYSNKEQNLVVTEINVDTLEHRNITYGLNGELVTLNEGTDYSVKESGTEVSWKSYQYTINAENFEAEGLYNVTIDSVDRATNEVNNKIKDANIEFVIDKTKPTVVITGVEDDGQYRTDARDITIAVEDNVAMGGVDLYVDDETKAAASYDGEDIRDQKGKLPYTLQDATDWQYLKAVAVDAAGNEADTEQMRVLITANMFVQYYRNTPLLVGSIIALVILAAGIVFIIVKRKKDKEEAK